MSAVSILALHISIILQIFPRRAFWLFHHTFGGEKDKPALPDVAIPPPARQTVPKEFHLLQIFPNPFTPRPGCLMS